ncbi:NAD(P)H-dependent glycerol-3-phosphate dehydrogenase [Bacillus bombysepticus]|uniref:NAD(P)H-dependent glycerol-3-phosphate dehydrogenase n=1 Tax=Bacillus bombysepticus TaxID=658666 RepID=UPI0030158BCF
MNKETHIGVIGSGSFGTALAHVLAQNDNDIRLFTRDEQVKEDINTNHRNSLFLENYEINSKVAATTCLETACSSSTILLAVPSHAMRSVMEEVVHFIDDDTTLIHVTKGLEQGTNLRMSEVMKDVCFNHNLSPAVAVLSGPSHAEEVVQHIPTVVAVGSESSETRKKVQRLFMNEWFRVYENKDMIGMELGGTLKNIIALAAGVMDGLAYGDNTKAALVTRGLAEITRLGVALGAHKETFMGLTGIGDLMVTANSKHSRNWRTGYRIGKGEKLSSITGDSHMVAEGVKATQVAFQYAKQHQLAMPITEQVYLVLFEEKNPRLAVQELMTRKEKEEWSVTI